MNRRSRFKLLFGTYSYLANAGNWMADLLPVFLRDALFSRLFASYGKGVYIDYRCYFRYFNRIRLGDNVTINRGCRFFASHAFKGLRQNLWVKNGPTGDSSWQGGFSEGWQGK